ncbi:Uma2 family endonuclease [Candidatus Poribacteria bacterium]|nr:Uma2 family endonuclease [Candidatus Poribacteria bacterium]
METLPLTYKQSKMSLSEFYALSEGPPYYEFEDGELIEMNRPTPRHQRVLSELTTELTLYLRRNPLGRVYPEVNVEFFPNKVYTPDLVFYTAENVRSLDEHAPLTQPPTLVIEILSSSTTWRDMTRKLKTYCESGVAWYWLIDPDELTVIEYHLSESGRYEILACVETGQVFRPGVFEGLEIDLVELMGEKVISDE